MASAVTALQAGIAAAPSGRVEFFTHGTSTLSSLVYSDADGVNRVTTTTLDAYGYAERYVGEPVDVVVYKADGSTLRTFTHVDDAKVVRLETSAFTGPNTNGNGQIVAGGRTTEDSAWTLLGASLAGTDGGVASGTGELPLSALASLVYFDAVRSYGADNTGNSDATAAIQAAMTAASTSVGAGGVVWLAPGTYKVSSALSVSSGTFSLMGAGQGVTTIKQYTAGTTTVTTAGASVISGITFATSGVTTGFDLGIGYRATIYNCSFTGTRANFLNVTTSGSSTTESVRVDKCSFTLATADKITVSTGDISYSNCLFAISNAAAAGAFTGSGSSPQSTFSGCTFKITAAVTVVLGSGSAPSVSACTVRLSASSGTTTFSNSTTALSGTAFLVTGAGNLQLTSSSNVFVEAGCSLVTTGGTLTVGTPLGGSSTTRAFQGKSSSAVTTSYAPDAANYGVHIYTQTGGAAFTLSNPSANCPAFGRLVVIWNNASGSNITPAFGTAYAAPAAAIVNNGQAACWEFIAGDGVITTKYVAIGPETVFTP